VIVELYGCTNEDTGVCALVVEYMQGGNLRHVLDSYGSNLQVIDDLARLSFARQVSRAVACIHSHGFLHRDIKAENFLLTSDFTVVKVHMALHADSRRFTAPTHTSWRTSGWRRDSKLPPVAPRVTWVQLSLVRVARASPQNGPLTLAASQR
jgi:serine/threonine protein kinase